VERVTPETVVLTEAATVAPQALVSRDWAVAELLMYVKEALH
jgi:hypothetical protein